MYIRLEHVNVTSPNPQKTANWMQKVFDWSIQWEGDTQDNGYSIHAIPPALLASKWAVALGMPTPKARRLAGSKRPT